MARKKEKKRWSELPKDQINGSKPMWVALSFLNTVGPLAYFAFDRRKVKPGA
jgi:hypothetical protein